MPRLQSFELVKCCRSAHFRTNSIHVLIQSCSVLLCFISNQADENGRDHIICCLSYQPYCHRIGVASNSHHTNGPTNQPRKQATKLTSYLSIFLIRHQLTQKLWRRTLNNLDSLSQDEPWLHAMHTPTHLIWTRWTQCLKDEIIWTLHHTIVVAQYPGPGKLWPTNDHCSNSCCSSSSQSWP